MLGLAKGSISTFIELYHILTIIGVKVDWTYEANWVFSDLFSESSSK